MSKVEQSRKTGGRKKGTPNRATAEMAAKIAESGLTPLDYMLSVMRNTTNTLVDRMEAAKAVAPYVHPKLAPVMVASEEDTPVLRNEYSMLEAARRIAYVLATGARQLQRDASSERREQQG